MQALVLLLKNIAEVEYIAVYATHRNVNIIWPNASLGLDSYSSSLKFQKCLKIPTQSCLKCK